MTATIQPAAIRKTFTLRATPERAFQVFTAGFGGWWPRTHYVGDSPLTGAVIEPRAGGRWYERDARGRESEWGTVLSYEPPHRLLLGWGFNADFKYDQNLLTEVELSFTANAAGGTEVRLEHRNLERFGADAAKVASRVGGGWQALMNSFAAHTDHHENQEV